MAKEFDRKIVLEDGMEVYGKGFGADRDVVAELVFNTSMVGYQEIISDPSYTDQAVVMTYPLIGNYGMNADDYETDTPTIAGMIVRDYCDTPCNFRSSHTLDEVMRQYGIAGVCEVDTRKLVRHIRDYGSCKALITASDTKDARAILENYRMKNDAVCRVSTGRLRCAGNENSRYHVAAIDCGMKKNIERMLTAKDCRLSVVPFDMSAGELMELKPDGIFLSNGPGNPQDAKVVIHTVKELIGKIPIFGICLGHQIISLAYGARTYKLKFGHRGGNHPVLNLLSGKVEMTSQNHSYAVDADSLKDTGLEITHINLLDHTVEGVRSRKDFVAAVQYHPESAPGPQDGGYMFDVFTDMMDEWTGGMLHAQTHRYS